jgi:DNA-binding IclR family transcriptional regulator
VAISHLSQTGGSQVLDRAFAMLDLFCAEAPEWGAAEVARELGLSLSTTSRILRALESKRLLIRTTDRRYRLGFGAIELGLRAVGLIDVGRQVRPALVSLARQSGETSVLATIHENRDAARVIDRVEGRDAIRVTLEIGHTWPLHAGALAKALLANMPDREAVLSRRLTKVGINTVTSRAMLRHQLDEIRRRGWAITAGETETSGIWGVAAPVLDPLGNPVVSMGVVVPQHRRNDRYEDTLVRLLLTAVAKAEQILGIRDIR